MFNNEAVLKGKIEERYGKGSARRSFLRQEQVIKNAKGKYEFDFNGNVTGKSTERKLNQQDVFFAHSIGLFLLREEVAKIGSGVLRTHVDPADFVAATGFVPAHLELLYNASLKAEINNETIFEALETTNFRKVPVQYMPQMGVEHLDPALVLNGRKKNLFTLNAETFAGIQWESVTTGTDNKVVAMLFGFQVFDVANV